MTITRSRNGPEVILDAFRTFFHHNIDRLRAKLARRRVYRRSYHELSVLSDRALADLGIPRSGIRRLARETAYGH